MKYIFITFDDGRSDNFFIAYPIMEKYKLKGTVFCTTGFIDGTWAKKSDWYSAEKGMTPTQLIELKKSGWEIALHGDKHLTDIDDTLASIKKMNSWGFNNSSFGFSIPDSTVDTNCFSEFINTLYPSKIKYIRKGRNIDTRKIKYRTLFAMYSFLNIQSAYKKFNAKNIFSYKNINRVEIPSVVVRFNDSPKMIIDFIKAIPDNSCVVFMFHSILNEDSKYYNTDPWNWSSKKFEVLCSELNKMVNDNCIEINTLDKTL